MRLNLNLSIIFIYPRYYFTKTITKIFTGRACVDNNMQMYILIYICMLLLKVLNLYIRNNYIKRKKKEKSRYQGKLPSLVTRALLKVDNDPVFFILGNKSFQVMAPL